MRVLWILLAAIGVLLGASVPVRAAWLPGAPIDGTGGAVQSVALGMSPDDAQGVLAWVSADAVAGHSRLRVATLSGGTWLPGPTIDTGSGDVSSPAVAIGASGGGAVAWLQSDGTHVRLWAASVAGGGVPGAPVAIDTGTKDVHAVAAAIDASGVVTIAYTQYAVSRERVYVRRGLPGSYSTPFLVDTGAGTSNVLQKLAVSSAGAGAAVAFMQGGTDGLVHPYVAVWAGASWAIPAQVDAGTPPAGLGNAAELSLSMAGADRGVVAWTQYLEGRRRVFGGVLTLGTWSVPTVLDATSGNPGDVIPSGDAFTPSVSADGAANEAVVVWSQSASSRRRVFSARLDAKLWHTAEASVWTPSNPLDAATSGDSTAPIVAIAGPGPDGLAAWYGWSDTDANFHVYIAVYSNGAWFAAQDLGMATGVPVIGVNSMGIGIAFWLNGSSIVQARDDTLPPTATLVDCTLLAGHEYGFQFDATGMPAGPCDNPSPFTYTGIAFDDSGLTYALWDFGDGTATDPAPAPRHVYAGAGVYPLGLTVRDAVGHSTVAHATVTVVDRDAPTISAGLDRTVEIDTTEPFAVDPATIVDVGGSGVDPASIGWSFATNGGSADLAPGASTTHLFDTLGEVVVTLTVADLNAPANVATDTATITVVPHVRPLPPNGLRAARTVTNVAPALLWKPVSGADHYVLSRDGAIVVTVPASATSYTDPAVSADGTYAYTMTTVSTNGLESIPSPEVPVTVDTVAPTGTITVPLVVEADTPTVFRLVGSETVSVAWTFGDGGDGVGPTASHSFTSTGTRSVNAVLTDLAGNGGRAAATITVVAPGTVTGVDAGPDQTVDAGAVVQFTGTALPVANVAVWSWDLGDGTTATGPAPTHAYPAVATFHVTMTVTDRKGTRTTDTLTVVVVPHGSVTGVDAGPNQAVRAGDVVHLAGVALPATNVVDWSWTLGDGTTATGQKPTHTYLNVHGKPILQPASFRVTLTVTDRNGVRTSDWLYVEVAPKHAPIVSAKGPSRAFVGDRVRFVATARIGQRGVRLTARRWSFGDGRFASGLVARHVFAKARAFVVYFTATDSKKRKARARVDITLRRLALVVTRVTQAGGRLRLTVRAGSAGSLRVRIGSGRSARTITARVRRAGTSTVTVKVGHRLRKGTRLALTLRRAAGAHAGRTVRIP